MKALIFLGVPGVWQIVILVLVILLLFGGRKIPELMRGIGQGMKEFKKATTEDDKGGSNKTDEEEKKIDK